MLQLNRDSAPYSELDFPQFNAQGFNRVRQAVEAAQHGRMLAQSAEQLREATNALRLANDIKRVEQEVAKQNFELEREKAFRALDATVKRFEKAYLPASKRLEMENRIDHLITLFNLKDFSLVQRDVERLLKMIWNTPAHAKPDRYSLGQQKKFRLRPARKSISALFKHGLSLEHANRRREAIEVYGQVIQRNPRHCEAIARLRHLGNVIEFKRENKQRRSSCTRKYKRYAG